MFCKNCGKEVNNKAVVCPWCGVETGTKKKPIFKKWWFWVIVGVVLIAVIGSAGQANSQPNDKKSEGEIQTGQNAPTAEENDDVIQAVQDTTVDGQIGDYIVKIKESKVTEDYEGAKILIVTYSFTNLSDESEAFMYTINETLFQNGVELGDVFSSYGIEGYDSANQSKEIKPGVTLDVQVAYKLNDSTTDVEVEISEFFSLKDDHLTYTIKISE